MDDSGKTYSVGELAELAGITRRTLHYYDEVGLLKPTRQAGNQRRRYQQSDLLRLQQITTLKYMGFSLKAIQGFLTHPNGAVAESLRMQREVVRQHIQQLQGAYYALSATLTTLEQRGTVDWEQVITVIRQLTDADRQAWLQNYLSDEVVEMVRDRAACATPDIVTAGAVAWEKLYTDFRAVMHLTPDTPIVQELAAQMHALIHQFTGGNTTLDQDLGEAYANLPSSTTATVDDQALQSFMAAALTIYRKGGT